MIKIKLSKRAALEWTQLCEEHMFSCASKSLEKCPHCAFTKTCIRQMIQGDSK